MSVRLKRFSLLLFLALSIIVLTSDYIGLGKAQAEILTKPVVTNEYTETIRVACVGDSITFGYGISNRDKNSYPAKLQNLLGDGFEVQNFGLSGARVTQDSGKPYYGS